MTDNDTEKVLRAFIEREEQRALREAAASEDYVDQVIARLRQMDSRGPQRRPEPHVERRKRSWVGLSAALATATAVLVFGFISFTSRDIVLRSTQTNVFRSDNGDTVLVLKVRLKPGKERFTLTEGDLSFSGRLGNLTTPAPNQRRYEASFADRDLRFQGALTLMVSAKVERRPSLRDVSGAHLEGKLIQEGVTNDLAVRFAVR